MHPPWVRPPALPTMCDSRPTATDGFPMAFESLKRIPTDSSGLLLRCGCAAAGRAGEYDRHAADADSGDLGSFIETDDFAGFRPKPSPSAESDTTETSEPHRCSRRGIAGGLRRVPSVSSSMRATTADGTADESTASASPECTSTVVMVPLACATYLPRPQSCPCQHGCGATTARGYRALPLISIGARARRANRRSRHSGQQQATATEQRRQTYKRNVGLGCAGLWSPVW
jgi:hypothetical protein